MDRRQFLAAASAVAFASSLPRRASAAAKPGRTQWRVRGSEGLDAVVFLGPLSGGELYRRFYAAEADEFAPKLPAAIRADIATLWEDAHKAGFGLLGPSLATLISGAPTDTLDQVIAALNDADRLVYPKFHASAYWGQTDWDWFVAHRARLIAVFDAMRAAGFVAFRQAHLERDFEQRVAEEQRSLGDYDVILLQEKLTGRTFDPVINVVLLQFAKPHGIRVQDQTFLQAIGYPTAVTVEIAAHEMLHPPFAMDDVAGKAALAALARDPLFPRIVREHDPKWGYDTLEGLFNEDICQALDQLISEQLGVGRNPADRWRNNDDGMHVLAGALYGMLRQDRWIEKGGNLEQWVGKAVADGRFAPDVLHPVAARVLERPVDRLWPLDSR